MGSDLAAKLQRILNITKRRENMKRILLLILSLLLLCTMFTGLFGCSEKENAETEDSTATTEQASDESYILPLEDMGGREFTILMPEGQIKDYLEDQRNPDTLNQGIKQRNDAVESALNCKIDYYNPPLNSELLTTILTAEMMAQTGDYDIVYSYYWWNIETHGYFYSLTENDVIAIDQPFYYQGWNDVATVRNTLNSVVGYGSVDFMRNTTVVMFNKSMYNKLFEGVIYDYVDSGDWTLQTMETMAMYANDDLNGDGEYKHGEDCFGITYHLWGGRAMFFACGAQFSSRNADGDPVLTYNTQKNVDIFDTLYDFMGKEYTDFYRDDVATTFGESKALFAIGKFEDANALRVNKSTVEYGFLPYPKYDENQDDYISTVSNCQYFAIPKTVESRHACEIFLNAFNSYSYDYVRPAYFDTVLKGRLADSREDAEIIDLIMGRVYVDFAFVYDTVLSNGLYNATCGGVFDLIRNGNKGFSSYCAEREEAMKINLEDLLINYVTPDIDY